MAVLLDYSSYNMTEEFEGVIVEQAPLSKQLSITSKTSTLHDTQDYQNTDRDSGSWSIDDTIDSTIEEEGVAEVIITLELLPGANLTQEELIETFATTTHVRSSKIPIPPPPPPLPSSSYRRNSDPSIFLHPRRRGSCILPGAFISNEEFLDAFSQNPSAPIAFTISYDDDHDVDDESSLCPICYERKGRSLFSCCNYMVCKKCVETIIKVDINEGRIYIPCLNPDCNKPLTRDFINKHLGNDTLLKEKYERFRINHEEDSSKKTCPNCCMITERSDLPPHKSKQITPQEYNIECDGCSFHWCFNCHSPWHEGVSCEMYRQGDKHFQKWTKHRNVGFVPNCQKCPKCKVFIERSSGCDHMTCNRCSAHFCYKCGGNFTSYPGLGDHYKKLGVLGCPYNYKPDQPVRRKMIRGGYLFVKAAATTGYPVLLVGGCVVVVVGAGVVLPIIGTAALYRYIRRKRRGW